MTKKARKIPESTPGCDEVGSDLTSGADLLSGSVLQKDPKSNTGMGGIGSTRLEDETARGAKDKVKKDPKEAIRYTPSEFKIREQERPFNRDGSVRPRR